ncbi:hypothetical protein OAO87_00545 [bacterium]|nr:hypothetical protein [bacterium]
MRLPRASQWLLRTWAAAAVLLVLVVWHPALLSSSNHSDGVHGFAMGQKHFLRHVGAVEKRRALHNLLWARAERSVAVDLSSWLHSDCSVGDVVGYGGPGGNTTALCSSVGTHTISLWSWVRFAPCLRAAADSCGRLRRMRAYCWLEWPALPFRAGLHWGEVVDQLSCSVNAAAIGDEGPRSCPRK